MSHFDGNLLAAVEQNDTSAVQQAIRNCANVNCVRRLTVTPRSGQTVSSIYGTPLTPACIEGFDGIVRLLLDAGATTRWQSRNGWSPMLEACRNGHFSIVEMLLNHDNGLLEITNDYGWTPLLSAIRYDHEHTTEIVQFLLNRGANVNANDAKVMTALMVACRERRLETMRLLLADGRCDVEARDKKYQQTALHYAADSDFLKEFAN
jgi:ankyrin repeat protein